MTENIIPFSDWEKLDLRVGQIKRVEEIEGADKLYKLEIDLGKEIGKRTVCAGLKAHYPKDKLKGIESQGMVLAAVNKDESKVILLSPEDDIEVGSRVR